MKMSQIFLIGYFIFLLTCMIYLFNPFLLTMSIGILLAVSTASIWTKILRFTGGKRVLASFISTALLALLFLVPFIYASVELSISASKFDVNNITKTVEYVKNYDFNLPTYFDFLEPKIKEFIASIKMVGENSIASKALKAITAIGKSSAHFIVDMVVIVIFYFFANIYGSELFAYLKQVVPMKKGEIEAILSEVANTASVVFYSTIINAMIQGVCFGIIAYMYGYDGFLMAILFSFASLIPIVGGGLVYIPVSLFEFANGNVLGAIIIFLYSVIFISTIIDSFLKPFIIKFINSRLIDKPTKINEMLIFFAMIAGITTFGFWGIILGPAILTLFIASVKVFLQLQHRVYEK